MRFVLSLEKLIRAGSIEEVEADAEAAVVRLEEAQRHLSSASSIAGSDPNGAYQLAYDAARKAVTAHMASAGFRVRATTGAHVVTASYATDAISNELGEQFDRMRRRRNRSEYAMAHFESAEIDAAVETANALIAAARSNAL